MLLVIPWLMPSLACGVDALSDREAKIKAAYILKLAAYVEWPASTFAADNSSLVFGVVGESEVTHYVELITNQRAVGNRSLVFKQVTSVEDARSCHVLFITAQVDQDLLARIADNLSTSPVLIVGEEQAFSASGEVITFVVRDNRVKLQLSMKAASQRQLKIGSQLAKLAEVVD